jgi:AcrR family transcriptional regulator
MGIDERRARERLRRRQDILLASWEVAEERGWSGFSVERVAARAELGRGTVYAYFESLKGLVLAMAQDALDAFSKRLAAAVGLRDALDVPVRFAQANPAAFQILFPSGQTPRPESDGPELQRLREEAKRLIRRLARLAKSSRGSLPQDSQAAATFVLSVSMAGAVIPELKNSTTLRRRWQDFCLGPEGGSED